MTGRAIAAGGRAGALATRLLDPRFRALGMTVGAGWAGRLLTAAAQFAAIRILSGMLGIAGYGAYAVITGLAGWFALADLGLGSSLQNLISARRVAGKSADDAIWTTARILGGTTVALAVALSVAGIWAGPFLLSHFPTVGRLDAVLAFATFASLSIGAGAAMITSRIYFAEHRGYLAHAISAGSAIAGVGLLMIIARLDFEHRLVWGLAVYYLPALVLPIGLLARRALRSPPGTPGLARPLDRGLGAELWRHGRMFLLFNALAALVLNVDYVILSQTVSAREVAVYAIYAKIFALVFFVYNSILQAYWPVSAEAIGRGDYRALRTLIPRAMLFGVVIVLAASLGLYLFLDWIGPLLTPHAQLALPAALIAPFALYWLMRVWCDTFGMIIMSAGKPLFLCVTVPVQAACNLALGIAGARYAGLTGLLLGMTASSALTVAWAAPAYVRHLARRAAGSDTAQAGLPGSMTHDRTER